MKKFSLLVFILMAVAGTSNAQKSANVTDTFPPNFGKGKTYLYVMTVPGYFQVNKALEKIMEKHYTGDYEIMDVRDFGKTPQKANVSVYSFQMIYDNQEGYFSPPGRVTPETNYSCGVRDASGKLYRLPYVGGNYKKVIEKYIKRLEEIRKTNEEAK